MNKVLLKLKPLSAKIQKFIAPAQSKITKFNAVRAVNTEKYKMTNLILTILFPIFIVSMTELNQGKYLSKFILFVSAKPLVFVFDIIMTSLVFCALLLLTKRGWLAAAIQGVVFMLLSITELFKFGANGNHLILTDMKLFKSVKSLTSFAYIKVTPRLIVFVVIVLTYIAAMFWFNPQIKGKILRRISGAAVCTAACLSVVVVPAVSNPVYSFFDVDTTAATNSFKLNEKFDNNSFLAFFVQTASENLANVLKEPDAYTAANVEQYVDATDEPANSDFKQPNVIMVMSEALADFRVFQDQLPEGTLPELENTDAYDDFDWVAAQENAYKGTAIVPTFASWTVRTEFELNLGLPVKSLNDPNMPQRVMLDRQQPTVARTYKDMGYATTYIHPFLGSFYSRSRVYANFDYDQLMFQDDLTVDTEYFTSSYISDKTVFNQIEKLINETDEPMYIHTTTMQNHQPYDGDPNLTEMQNYLAGVSATAESFKAFVEDLQQIDEPTVVLIVGDHFPSLKGDNSIYDQLGLNGDNCSVVYEQSYIVWSNYDLDYSKMPDESVSTFYLPYVMKNLIGAPLNEFDSFMLDKMDEVPVYSTNYDDTVPNDEELDVLTYDRILGDLVSDKELATINEESTDTNE